MFISTPLAFRVSFLLKAELDILLGLITSRCDETGLFFFKKHNFQKYKYSISEGMLK